MRDDLDYGEVLVIGGKHKGKIMYYDNETYDTKKKKDLAVCLVKGGEVYIEHENLLNLDGIMRTILKRELERWS